MFDEEGVIDHLRELNESLKDGRDISQFHLRNYIQTGIKGIWFSMSCL